MPTDFMLPRFELQCGALLADARLRYEMHGSFNAARDNAVLFPTWFAARHPSNRWIIGPGRGLDTDHYCVIVVDALGNGESSSPSNHAGLGTGSDVTQISLLDNVRLQAALLDSLGIERLHAVVGRSMGAQQALQWACLFPERVARVFALCGVPRTTPHNHRVLQGMVDVLEDGLRHGRGAATVSLAAGVYAGWTLSREFFNHGLWRGAASSEAEWLERNVRDAFARFDARDLLCLARTWQAADISCNSIFGGDLDRALRSIQAPVMLMPISHDLIFPPRDFDEAKRLIPRATSQTLVSEWGHRAGAPGTAAEDIRILEDALNCFLAPPRRADDCYVAASPFFRPT